MYLYEICISAQTFLKEKIQEHGHFKSMFKTAIQEDVLEIEWKIYITLTGNKLTMQNEFSSLLKAVR